MTLPTYSLCMYVFHKYENQNKIEETMVGVYREFAPVPVAQRLVTSANARGIHKTRIFHMFKLDGNQMFFRNQL